MPQELALFGELSIESTLTYFGRLFNMSQSEIINKIDFLLKLLRLPSKTKPISQLSGGQQRRVSLSVALLHSPQLLILDEPTGIKNITVLLKFNKQFPKYFLL